MSVGPAEIAEYVRSTWDSVLSLPVEPISSESLPDSREEFLTGCVQITGAWDGAVTLDIPLQLARRAAAAMFMVDPPDDVAADQMHDTVGELTNIVGGNLKALLPGPCYLTMPAVAAGTDYALRVLGSKIVCQAAFICHEQEFLVTVIERDRRTEGRPG